MQGILDAVVTSDPLLRVVDLHVRYGEMEAVRGLSFDGRAGEARTSEHEKQSHPHPGPRPLRGRGSRYARPVPARPFVVNCRS